MPTLKKTLTQMLVDARQNAGRPIRRTREDGLGLEVLQAPTGNVQLTLERVDTAPTDADWHSIISQWPELIAPGVVPLSRKDGRRFALVGRWARPTPVSETPA